MSTTVPVSASTADLTPIATPAGNIAVVAMDQRGSLRRMYQQIGREDVTDAEMVAFKADILNGLRGFASAFLLDPDLGVPAAKSLQAGPSFGTLIAAEPARRGSHQGEPVVCLDPEQDSSWVRAVGGDALKFLIQVRADRQPGDRDLLGEADQAVTEVVADCSRTGLPSVIENLIYPLPGEQLTPGARADAIIESAVWLDSHQPSLLKLEYPGSPQACRRLASRLRRPWAVLSAGVPMDVFTQVLKISCDEGGACGFIAGRAIWKDALLIESNRDRAANLAGEGRRRFEECLSAIEGRARSWQESR